VLVKNLKKNHDKFTPKWLNDPAEVIAVIPYGLEEQAGSKFEEKEEITISKHLRKPPLQQKDYLCK